MIRFACATVLKMHYTYLCKMSQIMYSLLSNCSDTPLRSKLTRNNKLIYVYYLHCVQLLNT
jgi:hypothetical protein